MLVGFCEFTESLRFGRSMLRASRIIIAAVLY